MLREDARPLLRQALAHDPGLDEEELAVEDPLRAHLARIVAGARFPSTLSALANIALWRPEREAAVLLFTRHLESHPPDIERVQATLLEVRATLAEVRAALPSERHPIVADLAARLHTPRLAD